LHPGYIEREKKRKREGEGDTRTYQYQIIISAPIIIVQINDSKKATFAKLDIEYAMKLFLSFDSRCLLVLFSFSFSHSFHVIAVYRFTLVDLPIGYHQRELLSGTAASW